MDLLPNNLPVPPSGVQPVTPGGLSLAQLASLSGALHSTLASAESELTRAKRQVADLQVATRLLDGVIHQIGNGRLSTGAELAFANTIGISGQMAQSACSHYALAETSAEKLLLASQIHTTLTAATSAYVSALPAEDKTAAEPIVAELRNHREELLSLEQRLANRLKPYNPHLQTILAGALDSYRDASNPLRFTNAGNGLRELLREFVAQVAPDDRVKQAPWFTPDPTSKNGVTRSHRYRYAIYGLLPKEIFPPRFVKTADEANDDLGKDIGRLSGLTHVTAGVLAKPESEAAPVLASAIQRFLLLIDAVETGKAAVVESITLQIQDRLDELFREDIFDDLDQLSSHTRPEGASDVSISITSVDEEWIYFDGTGTVECELQWGSDGDVERGDGAVADSSFPFTFSGRASASDPEVVEVDRDSIDVDTRSFYE